MYLGVVCGLSVASQRLLALPKDNKTKEMSSFGVLFPTPVIPGLPLEIPGLRLEKSAESVIRHGA
jgi:hypothetical protein